MPSAATNNTFPDLLQSGIFYFKADDLRKPFLYFFDGATNKWFAQGNCDLRKPFLSPCANWVGLYNWLVEKMLQKMNRHSRLIGPSIKISEMIRDYSEWLYEREVEAVNSKYNKFSTKIYNMMFGRMGCSICALLSLIAIVWMCFSDSLLPKLLLIVALLYPVVKRLAPKIQRSIELWMCKKRLNKRMKIAEKFDV